MEECKCGHGKFPLFAIIVLIIGLLWLFKDLGWITTNIPWLPLIIVILAIGWLVGFYGYKKK